MLKITCKMVIKWSRFLVPRHLILVQLTRVFHIIVFFTALTFFRAAGVFREEEVLV